MLENPTRSRGHRGMRRSLPWAATLALLPALALAAQQQGAASDGGVVEPPAQIAVSPGKFELEIGTRPRVESLKIINFSDRAVDIRVSVVTWDLDDNSKVRVLEPTETSLDRWMVINPGTFTLPARGEQTVRFSIRPRTRPETGEHRAMIYFEEVPRSDPDAGVVQVRFKLGVAVYAFAGDVERVGDLAGLRVGADPGVLSAVFDIASLGNAHVRMLGQYAVWPVDAFPGIDSVVPMEGLDRPGFRPETPVLMAGTLPNTPVLGGSRRPIVLAGGHDLPAGRYVLSAVGRLGDSEFREAVEFAVPPAVPAAVGDRQQEPARR